MEEDPSSTGSSEHWGCLNKHFCHRPDKHGPCFRAIAVLEQLAIEFGEPLFFDVEYNDDVAVETTAFFESPFSYDVAMETTSFFESPFNYEDPDL